MLILLYKKVKLKNIYLNESLSSFMSTKINVSVMGKINQIYLK